VGIGVYDGAKTWANRYKLNPNTDQMAMGVGNLDGGGGGGGPL